MGTDLRTVGSGDSWRRPLVLALVAAGTVGLGFAVRRGEDNQVLETNAISFYIFVLAGVIAYWALLRFMIILLRHLKKRRR